MKFLRVWKTMRVRKFLQFYFIFLAELSLSETIIDVMYFAPVVSIVMIVTLTKDGCSLNTYSKHPQRCTHTTHTSSKSDPNLSVSPFTHSDRFCTSHSLFSANFVRFVRLPKQFAYSCQKLSVLPTVKLGVLRFNLYSNELMPSHIFLDYKYHIIFHKKRDVCFLTYRELNH